MAPEPACRLSRTEHRQSRFHFLLLRRSTYSSPHIALKHFQSTPFFLWKPNFRTHTTHKKRVSIPNSNLPITSSWKEIFIWHETMQCGTQEQALRLNLLLPTWRQKNRHLLQFVEFIAHIYITILLRILMTNIKTHHIWLKISTFWPVTSCHRASGSCIAWGITIVCNFRIACPTTQHFNLQDLISPAKPCENQVWRMSINLDVFALVVHKYANSPFVVLTNLTKAINIRTDRVLILFHFLHIAALPNGTF